MGGLIILSVTLGMVLMWGVFTIKDGCEVPQNKHLYDKSVTINQKNSDAIIIAFQSGESVLYNKDEFSISISKINNWDLNVSERTFKKGDVIIYIDKMQ